MFYLFMHESRGFMNNSYNDCKKICLAVNIKLRMCWISLFRITKSGQHHFHFQKKYLRNRVREGQRANGKYGYWSCWAIVQPYDRLESLFDHAWHIVYEHHLHVFGIINGQQYAIMFKCFYVFLILCMILCSHNLKQLETMSAVEIWFIYLAKP